MHDVLGERMKTFYEDVAKTKLTRRIPVIGRLDGKAFHTLTRNMKKPYDEDFQYCMWQTAKYLCENIQGCKLAYVQSDEISLLLIDYAKLNTDAWFGYQVQKMCSVAASMCSVIFNKILSEYFETNNLSVFDARFFNIPKEEVNNYFLWRQNDASRNSVSCLAQSQFSHKELHGKNTSEMQDMLMLQKGINWNGCPVSQKRGVCIKKETYMVGETERSRWVIDENIPIFSQDRDYIQTLVDEIYEN